MRIRLLKQHVTIHKISARKMFFAFCIRNNKKNIQTVTSDVSTKGESECEATSLDFVILDYYIIFKLNLNIENVLEKQEISKNKQSRHTQNRFPLFLKSISGWKWQWVSGLLSGLVLFLQICTVDTGVAALRRVIGSCSVTQSVENQAEPVCSHCDLCRS